MLQKTIKKVVRKKIKDWLDTIDDCALRETIKSDLIVTGGCFASFILGEEVNDYDCYFKTKETTIKVAEYYVNKWNETHGKQLNKIGYETKVFVLDGANPSKDLLQYYHISKLEDSASRMISNTTPDRVKIIFPSDGIVGDPNEANQQEELGLSESIQELDEISQAEILAKEKKAYFPVFLSTNAITLSNGIQLIVRFYGGVEKIHETFDFVHTRSHYDYDKDELSIPNEVYDAVTNKHLLYVGSKYPVCSVFRLRKFINRGWSVNAGQMLKMCLQISELNLHDIDVLEDQLVGVDSLYFKNMIESFAKYGPEKITTDYVISVVDKIFS